MDMTLYRAVGSLNRIALGDLATAEYYAAARDEKGIITLMPVNIVGAVKRGEPTTAADAPGDEDDSAEAPFDSDN